MYKLSFSSDYQEGAHPEILNRLVKTNLEKTSGYGADPYCDSAKNRIRQACACPQAQVEFLVGGTQTNAVVIDALLPSYQGVIAAESGHISIHEAGAIEYTGHRVLTLPGTDGKLSAQQIRSYCNQFYQDGNHDHMVMPGMVYLSLPTEYGTLYSLQELTEIRAVCDAYHLHLYIDGARLAYALACPQNDVTLPDLARLCDVFYIGGTKCGCLFGEAVVVPNPNLIPHFFTIIKQHGALLAKGRLLGLQFDTLFTDDLYLRVGKPAIQAADTLREIFQRKGYQLTFHSPTNQVFVVLENSQMEALAQKLEFNFWEAWDETHTIVRFATSWATDPAEAASVEALLD